MTKRSGDKARTARQQKKTRVLREKRRALKAAKTQRDKKQSAS
jgi:hypothetical protein